MLSPEHIVDLADAAMDRNQPFAVMAAIDGASKATLRHDLFTAMRFRPAPNEVERVYSSHPDAYLTGGRKKKLDTSCARDVLLGRRPFIGEGEQAIRKAFVIMG